MKNLRKKKSSQSQRFIEKAREIGYDEDEPAFDERLRKIAKAVPPKEEKTKRLT